MSTQATSDAGPATCAARAGRAITPVPSTALIETAERTLPTLTIAVGDGPRRTSAEAAARVFGLEPEGMSPEDRDFEIARQFVRFARAATLHAVTAPAPDPATAVAQAGRLFAPGLVPPARHATTGP